MHWRALMNHRQCEENLTATHETIPYFVCRTDKRKYYDGAIIIHFTLFSPMAAFRYRSTALPSATERRARHIGE